MKNTLSEMKDMLKGIKKVNKGEDGTINTEDGETKDTQSEWQEKGSQDYNNLRSLWDAIKGKNICIIRLSKGKQEAKELLEEILMEKFPHLVKKIDI